LYHPRTLPYIDIKPDLMIMESIMNLMNLGRVLCGSWVRVGEGCVDWTG